MRDQLFKLKTKQLQDLTPHAGALGLDTVASYQAAMGLFLACNASAYAWFLLRGQRHNVLQTSAP